MRVLVGGDPEIFLRRGNQIFPCVGLIPGTKQEPYPVPDSRVGLTVQEDGVALELGFTPVPVTQFRNQIRRVYDEALTYVRRALGGDVNFSSNSSHQFKSAELISPQARTLGCDPDKLAHEGVDRKPPQLDDIGNFRFTGGHIHIGYNKKETPVPETAIVQFMDLAYLCDIYDGRDQQTDRRKFYGLAGLYRKKSYGLEYRTPSAFWFFNSGAGASYMAQIAEAVINKPSVARSIWKAVPWELVKKSIDEGTIHAPMSEVYGWLDTILHAPSELGDEIEPLLEEEETPLRAEELDEVYEDDFFDEEEAA